MTSSLIRTFLSAIQPSTPDGFATGINPMAAYSTTPDLSFYNLCGILRIGITGKDTTIQSISFSDNIAEKSCRDLSQCQKFLLKYTSFPLPIHLERNPHRLRTRGRTRRRYTR